MQNKQIFSTSTKLHKSISAALLLAAGVLSPQAQAAMPTNAILDFTTGVGSCEAGGTYPTCTYGASTVATGSYFSMDLTDIGNFTNNERTPITTVGTGVNLGGTQPEGAIDTVWQFGNNDGQHLTLTAPSISSDDGAGNVKLSMTGWTVHWGAEGNIDMGSGAAATVTCASTCGSNDTFTLIYTAVVPTGAFAGVNYQLYLTGTIAPPPPLTALAGDTYAVGTFDVNDGSSDGRITMDDLTKGGITADSGYLFATGLFNFSITAAGASTEVMIPLTAPIPAGAVYRKLVNGDTWTTFSAGGGNLIASAAKVSGTCPAVSDAAYDHTNGLVEGDECIEITLVDGGTYDYDGLADNTIIDPGGVATVFVEEVDTRTWGTSGCSLSETPVTVGERADWWLVAGFMGMLGWLQYRRRSVKQV